MSSIEEKSRSELITELRAARAEITVLNAVQEALAQNLDLQGIYDVVGDKIVEIFGAQTVAFYSADLVNDLLHFPYTSERGVKPSDRTPAPINSLYRHTIDMGKTFVCNEGFAEYVSEFVDYQIPWGELPASIVVVPVIMREDLWMGISLQDMDRENVFTESDVQFLETLAASMRVALENARLFDETQHLLIKTEERNAELAVINSVQVGLAAKLDLKGIYRLVGDKISEITGAGVVLIATWDWGTRIMRAEYFRDQDKLFGPVVRPLSKLHDVIIPKLESGETIVWNEGIKEIYTKYGHVAAAGDIPKSSIAVPLKVGGKMVSSIMLQDTQREYAFNESTVRLIETLAGSMSVALENALLFEEINRRNHEITEALDRERASNDILRIIAESPTDIKPVLEVIARNAAQLSGSEDAVIAITDGSILRVDAHYGDIPMIPIGEGISLDDASVAGCAILEGKTLQAIHNQPGTESDYPQGDQVAAKYGYGMTCAVPLMREGQAIGTITIRRLQADILSDQQIALIQSFANQAAIAIENVRLFNEIQRLLKETEERNAELAVITSVQQGLSSKLDIQSIYDLVGEKIRETFDAQVVVLRSYDLEQQMEIGHYVFEKGVRDEVGPYPFSPLGQHIVKNKDIIVINSNFADRVAELTGQQPVIPGGEMPRSVIFVPLFRGQEVSGSISLQNIDHEHAFSDSDVRLLTTLANSMSVALENARLFDETQRLLKETEESNTELALINSVQQGMVRELDFNSIINLVGDQLREIFNSENLGIRTYDASTEMIHFSYEYEKGRKLELAPSPLTSAILSAHIIKTKKTVRASAEKVVEEIGMSLIPGTEMSKSILSVPFLIGDQVRGFIHLEDHEKEDAFSASEQRLLETLAASMSVALENARLFEQIQNTNREISQALERQTATSDILHIIANSPGEIKPVLNSVARHATRLCEADDVQIYVVEGDQLVQVAHHGPLAALKDGESLPLKPGLLTGKAVLERRIIHIDAGEISKEEFPISFELQKRLNHRSVIITPLVREDDAFGAIVARRNEVREFSYGQIALLSTFANQAAIAIENVRLFEETKRLLAESRQQAEELQTVNTVSTALSSELELEVLIELVGSQVQKIFSADIAYLALLNKKTGFIEFPYNYGEEIENLKFGEGLTSRVIQEGEPVLINQDEDWSKTGKRIGVKSKSYLGVPISVGKEVIGVVSVQSTKWTNMYGEKDVRLLSTIAGNVGVAIDKANLFEEVEKQKRYFEALITSAPVAIITMDMEGNVTDWSPAAESLFGYAAEEAIGAYIDDLVANHPDIKEEAELITQQYIDEIGRIQLKSQRTHKDGDLIDVAIDAMPIHIEDVVGGYIAIYTDISELEKARRDAEHANKAKSTFLANMSHELRTPLNAIIGFTRIVKRKGVDLLPQKQIENLDKVLVSAEHLLGLINTVLDISKIEAGRMDLHITNFDLKSLIDLALVTTQPLVRQDAVKLTSDLPDELPMIHTDLEKIKQILLNLLSNAAKFTHEGEIKVVVREADDNIKIDVVDTGIGISADSLEKIFQEFQQADTSTTREYGGTGLGLAISRNLARLLGGDLEVTSEPGVGSTFTLTFPIHFSLPEEVERAEEPDEPPVGDEHLVLVIDDNEDSVYLIQESLQEAGYRVAVAHNGEEGLAMTRELVPFAITLDIMMPKRDGWQVLHDLKSDPGTRGVPVILISIVDKKALGFRLGAADYLVKPLKDEQIIESLEKLKRTNGDRPIKRLLVVDDDPNVSDMVEQLLEQDDYQVESALDGWAALEKIRQDRPDAVLLDLMMPHLDGFGFIEELKKDPSYDELPIIVLTAKLLNEGEKQALNASVSRIIRKQGLSGEALLDEIGNTIKSTI